MEFLNFTSFPDSIPLQRRHCIKQRTERKTTALRHYLYLSARFQPRQRSARGLRHLIRMQISPASASTGKHSELLLVLALLFECHRIRGTLERGIKTSIGGRLIKSRSYLRVENDVGVYSRTETNRIRCIPWTRKPLHSSRRTHPGSSNPI